MADEHDHTFRPAPDEGQPGWVTLSTGQRAFRYDGEDDMIYDSTSAPDGPGQ